MKKLREISNALMNVFIRNGKREKIKSESSDFMLKWLAEKE